MSTLVYGVLDDDSLVFIPESQADRNAAVHRLVSKANEEDLTWAQVRAIAPPGLFEEAYELGGPESEDEKFMVPAYYDGDWPLHPAQGMEDWMPDEVLKKYAIEKGSAISGTLTTFSSEDLDGILKMLDSLGIKYRHDENLVSVACGW